MTLVHLLNPDGESAEPKIHKHPISDDKFEELKQKYPWAIFSEKPSINLLYYPWDWISSSGNIKGVAILISTYSSLCVEPVQVYDKKYESQYASFDIFYSHNGVISFNSTIKFFPEDGLDLHDEYIRLASEFECLDDYNKRSKILDKMFEIRNKSKLKFEISHEDFKNLLSEDEKKIFSYFENLLPKKNQSNFISAYNGILADTSDLLDNICFIGMGKCISWVLLLRGDYLPKVDIDRDKIEKLSLKAVLELDKLKRKVSFGMDYYSQDCKLVPKRDIILTEKDFFEFIDKNQELEDNITFAEYTLSQLKEIVKSQKINLINCLEESFLNYVRLAILKKHFTVCYKNGLHIKKRETNETDTSEFPVRLFFSFDDDSSRFAKVNYVSINFYNQDYPFSQWLIKHQKELIEKVPGIYHSMIDKMIFGVDTTDILYFLNSSLKRLQTYQHNFFEITDDLFLKPEDFIR